MKRETDKSVIRIRSFIILFSIIDRKQVQRKTSKDIEDVDTTVNQIDLIDVYSREEIPGLASRSERVTGFRTACTSQRTDKVRMQLNEKCFLSRKHTHEASQ